MNQIIQAGGDLSRAANKALGDDTGRSISRRTAHGFKNVSGLEISDEDAEHMVHGGMILAMGGLFYSKNNQTVLIITVLLIFILFLLYHIGKEEVWNEEYQVM